MARIHRRSLREPDERVEFPLGHTAEVELAGSVVGRSVHQPGWRWSEHIKPRVGTPSCQVHHVGVVLSGRFGVRLDGGSDVILEPDEVYDIPPGHEGWVVGDEPLTLLEWTGVHGWATPVAGERVLASIVFTDIVGSTELAARLGDRPWARLLEEHDARMRAVLDRFRGRQVATTGDGLVAIFDGAERAVRAAAAIGSAAQDLDLQVRVAVHTGEVELVPDNIRGMAVHIAARMLAIAEPGEVLVSETTRGLVESPDLEFVDRGEHAFKGVRGGRRVHALAASGDAPAQG